MKLTDLEPHWMQLSDKRTFREVETVEAADGIRFLCPVCFQRNNGPVGTHSILCWRPRVPADIYPAPGRWEFQGGSFDDLTLVAGSSSILLQGGCNAHFFIRDGKIC